jgi:hypothetical protein
MKKMKNEEVRMKNENEGEEREDLSVTPPPRPEHGADSQLHNYNVMLTRLGDLFGDDDEPEPPKK